MDRQTAFHLVALSELPQVGPKGQARILALNQSLGRTLEQFFHLPAAAYREEYRLPPATAECLTRHRGAYEQHCGALADRLLLHDGLALRCGEPGYPRAWVQFLTQPPPVVFALGDTMLLQQPTAAVLNSRSPSVEAIVATRAVVARAARDGFCVASGAMKLGHRIAAASARAAQAGRIIVLDRGLFAALGDATERDIFGLSTGHLRLDRSRTLVLSPFRLDNHAAPVNGARRDSLIAALSDVVICIEARPGGHMEELGLDMLARGKLVACWRGHNLELVAAGARSLEEDDLANGLPMLLGETG
jgi:predicted Rossmann fold nucleotide-binding protein DprA/Smf involved in DNA uptake